jgi:DNA invertase Pin-like site-specific DNA recombinase
MPREKAMKDSRAGKAGGSPARVEFARSAVSDDRAVGRRVVSAIGYVSANAGRIREARLKEQIDLIEDACIRRGWVLRRIICEVDPAAGGGGARPALDHAFQQLEGEPGTRLVVAHLDTLSRSVAGLGGVLSELERRGGHLLCLDPEIDTESSEGATVMRGLIAVSDHERERLVERTRKGLVNARSKRAQSRPAVEDRPEIRERILAMRARGMTLQAIADALNADGVPTLRGGERWRPSSVHATTGYKRRGSGRSEWPPPDERR